MGKQSKRKNKRRGGKHHRPTGLADDPAASSGVGVGASSGGAEAESPVGKIIQKIRHGDPRVRHASLVALSRTLYDCNALENAASSAARGKKSTSNAAQANNPILLRALSEKILDVDIPCATTAVGCLSNYVSFYCGNDGTIDQISGNDFGEDVPSDVMVPIFLQRLQSSLGTLRLFSDQMMQQNSNKTSSTKESKKSGSSGTGVSEKDATEKHWPKIKEQWTLLTLSISTLAALIENCPKAHERCGANAFPQLLAVLDLAHTSINIWTTGNFLTQKEVEPISDAMVNCARAFHSLLDDNEGLITSLPIGSVAASAGGTNNIPSLSLAVSELAKTITNSGTPTMARLHASGSILSLRRVLVLESELVDATADEQALVTALQSCTNDVIVPLLSTLFASHATSSDGATPKQLLSQMMDLSQKLSTIQSDKAMEDAIVNEVKARKEPARDIARRQKKMKEEKKVIKQADMNVQAMNEEKVAEDVAAGAAMVVEDNDSTQDGDPMEQKKDEQQQAEDELKDELDGIVASWKDLVGSHKLALELVANLCSGGNDEEDGDMGDGIYEDEDEHMWDSDDEANLIADANTNQNAAASASNAVHPCEQAMYESMATKHHLPENILGFFRGWIEFIATATSASGTSNAISTMSDESTTDVPALVTQDVDEILSTCALCLGNIAARDLSTWKANGLEQFWNELFSLLPNQQQHVTSVMLSMLQNQPPTRALVNEAALGALIAMLVKDDDKNAPNEARVQTDSNIISMFGVLCSEPHPASVNSVVCCALVQRLQSSNSDNINQHESMKHSDIITHEIFNVLIDMYGGDDAHDEVFGKEKVLDHFRRILPGFKRRIKKVIDAAAEEKGVWNETALNVSRFIKYKSGGN